LAEVGSSVEWGMEIFVGVMIFVIGLCCGSFVNMLEYRTARKYRLTKAAFVKAMASQSRSFCDYCGRQLRWYENVPVVSWIIQGGKTKCCNKKLPLLYPIVELGVGILFLIGYGNVGILGLVIITLLVFSAVFDLKYMILPDFSTGILIILSITLIIINKNNIFSYVVSGLGASGFLMILNLITKGKGMGMGDVKLALFMGLLLGPVKVITAFYIAFIVGALISLILIGVGRASRKSLVPFGPFLILGTVVAWFLDGSLVDKMINLIR